MLSSHLLKDEKDLNELTSLLNEIDICGDFYDRIVTSRSELRNDENKMKETFKSIDESVDFESFQRFDEFIKSDNFWDDFLLLGLTEERDAETETDDQSISESKFADTVKMNKIIFKEKSETKDLTFLLDVFDEFEDLFDTIPQTYQEYKTIKFENNTDQLVNMNKISLFINSKLFWSEILKLQSELHEGKNDDKYQTNDLITFERTSCECGCINSTKCTLINQFNILTKFNSVVSNQNEIVETINKIDNSVSISKTADKPSEISSIVPNITASLIRDFDVIRMKSMEIITLDEFQKSKSENKNILNNFIHISNEIEILSKTGISKKLLFPLFIISFACILMVIKIKSESYTNSPMLLPMIWTIAFVFNVVAVSIPGRLDRMYSEGCHIRPWQSLFEPSSWTFAIWGVIYFAELAITIYIGWIHFTNVNVMRNVELFKPVLPYWTAGNCFQALWCFVFRPEFKAKLWIPSSCLFLSALSLFGAYHEVYQIQKNNTNSNVYSSNFVYITKSIVSIHATWLFCSALIVLNSWASLSGIAKYSKGASITFAFLSTFLVAIFGAYFTIKNSDVFFALTCAWALDGFASRSTEKLKLAQKEIQSASDTDIKKHVLSPDIYETLSLMETILSGGLKCLALGTFISSISNYQI